LRTLTTCLALAACALGPSQAHAAMFRSVVLDKSSVTFDYRQMGVPMEGRFGSFAAQLSLDTDKADQATGRIDIDLASIDTGSREANQEVVGRNWFNVAGHPRASFVLQGLKSAGPGRFEATGQLTVKGQTRELRVPITLTPQNALSGGFVLKRADFGIGEGMWSKFDIVANEINVKFTLNLK
jgi:polyisoprenoid-binding protein YceI